MDQARSFQSFFAAADLATKARIISLANPFSSCWLLTLPACPGLKLSCAEVRIAAFWRLGLDLPSSSLWNPTCAMPTCTHKNLLDLTGHHFGSCPCAASAKFGRHSKLISAWKGVLASAGVSTIREPKGVFSEPGLRPDLFASAWPAIDSMPVAVDVTIVDPGARSYVPAAARAPLATASAAERMKRKKYATAAVHLISLFGAPGIRFFPLAFESFGAWGSASVSFLHELAALAKFLKGTRPDQFFTFHRNILAVALCRETARLLASAAVKQTIQTFNVSAHVPSHVMDFVEDVSIIDHDAIDFSGCRAAGSA